MKKGYVIFTLILVMTFSIIGANNISKVNAAPSGRWIDLGQGWRFRVDPPHTGSSNAKWHVHVENTRTGVKGSEGVDGSASHGDHMNKIPSKVRNKVKGHGEYKKGKEKQKKLKSAAQKVKSRKLKIDWKHVGDVIVAIALVIAATGFVFFQGDDIAAWINLLRALGC